MQQQPDSIPKDGPPPKPRVIPSDPSQAAMQSLLGTKLRCTLTDGRTATGIFICMDRLKNIILTDVLEEREINVADYRPQQEQQAADSSRKIPVQRELAQAMIPGKHLVKVEIESAVYDLKLGEVA